MRFHINQWSEIRTQFDIMFGGLGSVEASDEILHFTSVEPYVATGITLSRKGAMTANMPLHNLDSTFDRVEFNESLTEFTLIGNSLNYTYRIPSEILAIRSQSS